MSYAVSGFILGVILTTLFWGGPMYQMYREGCQLKLEIYQLQIKLNIYQQAEKVLRERLRILKQQPTPGQGTGQAPDDIQWRGELLP